MMLRILASAAALSLALPVSAQEDSPPAVASVEQNLDCAIWASFQTGTATDVEVKNAFAIAVGWFIGLYEGQTGELIADAFAARTAELSEADVMAMTPVCVSRFAEFGERLSTLGDRIDAQEQ